MGDVVYFEIFAPPTIKDTLPLYDDNDDLIGGAAPETSNELSLSSILHCFVAAKGHPVSLNLCADIPVYVQLIEENGYYKSGKITTVPPTITKLGESYHFPQFVRTE